MEAAIGNAEIIATTDLTETYNLAEHQKPDCALIAQGLTALPEFELLTSLFKIMGISCFSLVDGSNSECPSSYKMGHQRGLSIGGSGSFV